MTDNKKVQLKQLEEQISLKLKEGKVEEAEQLSQQMIQLAEADEDFVLEGLTEQAHQTAQKSSQARSQDETDEEHLKLLGLLSYIVGGMVILFGFFPLFHVAFGSIILMNPDALGSSSSPPMMAELMGGMFVVMGLLIAFTSWIYGGCMLYAGRCLRSGRRYLFTLVMACISCMHFPIGTTLGVFTILVLRRPSVRQKYGK